MALQDLTPQLRTRMSRVEHAVGVFVVLATLLLLTAFIYYVYHTIQKKGWLVPKVNYYTMLSSAAGLHVGDAVNLMGFPAGEITRITPNEPDDYFDVTVEFVIRKPNYGYVWTDSTVKVGANGLLGSRFLEVTKGGTSGNTNIEVKATYDDKHGPLQIWVEPDKKTGTKGHYALYTDYAKTNGTMGFWLFANEPPALADQVSRLISQVENALPNILGFTNQIAGTMSNSASLMVALHETIQGVQPIVTNLAAISTQLRNPQGSLGDWLIPTQINQQVQGTLNTTSNTIDTARNTIYTAQTNLALVASNLNQSLENMAGITANLRQQIQANSLMLSEISSLVVGADDFLQGLKRNWLLKSSFAGVTNKPLESLLKPGVGGAP